MQGSVKVGRTGLIIGSNNGVLLTPLTSEYAKAGRWSELPRGVKPPVVELNWLDAGVAVFPVKSIKWDGSSQKQTIVTLKEWSLWGELRFEGGKHRGLVESGRMHSGWETILKGPNKGVLLRPATEKDVRDLQGDFFEWMVAHGTSFVGKISEMSFSQEPELKGTATLGAVKWTLGFKVPVESVQKNGNSFQGNCTGPKKRK